MINVYTCWRDKCVPYSLNILRMKIYADFDVLGFNSENFIPEPPYSLTHLKSLANIIEILSLKIFWLYGID